MRWQAVVVLLMTVCLPLAASGVNLLGKAQGCILSGSSFAAEQKSWKLETVHYFDRLADGKKHTCWKAFDSKAPHYIKARWRTPVKFNQIEWQGRNFEKLALKVWRNGQYELLTELAGVKGKAVLPLSRAERIQLDIIGANNKAPRLYEVVLSGPDQPLPPVTMPDKYLDKVSVTLSNVTPANVTAQAGDTVKIEFDAQFNAPNEVRCPRSICFWK